MAATLELDAYVIEVLMPDLVGHDRHPSAFLVYLYLWRQTGGGKHPSGELSLATMAECTGLSKRAVQMALVRLLRRQLVVSERGTSTAPHSLRVARPWTRSARRS
jgi:hypothetical protein